jgi:large subunit ribosomal protein L1
MGKIRIKNLGDEKQKKQEKKKTAPSPVIPARPSVEVSPLVGKVADAPRGTGIPGSHQTENHTNQTATKTKTYKKTKKSKFAKKQKLSNSYIAVAQKIDKNKKYLTLEALKILPSLKRAKFDETVELHINTTEQNISGNIILPHGTGKKIKIEIANLAEDPKHVEEIVKKVEAGNIDFDILIATPDSMSKLAKIARVLGPRGLMPNPKNGTVTPKPQEVAKKFQGGQINFKTESKFPILHLTVGKISFGEKKLSENIQSAIAAVQTKNIKNITLKSTMSPGIKLDLSK